jgi:hypothetical protein
MSRADVTAIRAYFAPQVSVSAHCHVHAGTASIIIIEY